MDILRRAALCAMVVAVVMGSAGCTVMHSSFPVAQSHFDYPNSNVSPLGHARGEASTTSIMIPTMMDADLIDTAVQNALKGKGGDILIDYTMTTKVTQFWLFLTFFTTTVTVEGTAAKMEIGKQILH